MMREPGIEIRAQVEKITVHLSIEPLDQKVAIDFPPEKFPPLATSAGDEPKIGELGSFGIYAGIARGADDAGDHIIEVLEVEPDKQLNYQDAMKWAESVGGVLPTRRETALLFANVPELFGPHAYWTADPYAGNDAYAWYQSFYYGLQFYDRKGYELRARAVRRLTL